MHETLQPIEQLYSPLQKGGVSDEITGFFASIRELSANPDEIPVRSNVRESAKKLVSSIQRLDDSLQSQRSHIDEQVSNIAQQISSITKKVAELNIEILTLEAGSETQANDLRDQQEKLVRDLSEKLDINVYNSQHGTMTIRGPSQALLVDGKIAADIVTSVDAETGRYNIGVVEIDGNKAKNITETVSSGQLASLVEVRDKIIPQLINRNDELAVAIANEVNQIHRQGFGMRDFSESTGRDFFTFDGGDASAKSMNLSQDIFESLDAISVAATPNAPGDNIIANELLRIKDQPLMADGSMSFLNFYSNGVGLLGIQVEKAESDLKSDEIVLGDMKTRRESISGVSLDEEAVNLLKWQTAFAASSKVITTVDEMMDTVLSLKR